MTIPSLPTNIPFGGTLVPAGDFPGSFADQGYGGFHIAQSIAEKNAISDALREKGMLCYIAAGDNEGKTFRLNAAPWDGTGEDWTLVPEAQVPAVIFNDTQANGSLLGNHSVNPSSIMAGTVGAVNFGSDTASGGLRVTADYAATLSGDQGNATATYACVVGGFQNTASGNCSFVGGGDANTASGAFSSVLGGQSCSASGDNSTALGNANQANGVNSFAGGHNLIINGDSSAGFGFGNTTNGDYAFVAGQGNFVSGNGGACFGTGNQATADYSFAVGQGNVVSGARGAAFGLDHQVLNPDSLACGNTNIIVGQACFATGRQQTVRGQHSAAFGGFHTVDADQSVAEGNGHTLAAGAFNVHAEGTNCQSLAGATNGHVEGDQCIIAGANAHAEGFGCYANANHTHAQNISTVCNGTGSTAIGDTTTADGYASFSMGLQSNATRASQFAIASGQETTQGDRQTSLLVFRGFTTGIAVGETAELGSGGVPTPFSCGANRVYAMRLRASVAGTQAGPVFLAACLERTVCFYFDGTNPVVVEAQSALVVTGNAGASTWTLDVTPGPIVGHITISVTTGATQTAINVACEVQFTESTF